MSIPRCENTACDLPAARNAKNTGYLRHCSRTCLSACNSRKGSEKRKQTNLDRYGVTCNLKHSGTQEKIQKTNLAKYGVEHHMKSNQSKEKLQATKLERYGNSAYNNRDKFRQTLGSLSEQEKQAISDTRKNTVQQRYGVDYITQSAEFKQKTLETNLVRYGYANVSCAPAIKQKISGTQQQRYGSHHNQQHIPRETLEKLSDTAYLTANCHRSLTDLGAELDVTYHTVNYAYQKYKIERTYDQYRQSLAETEILNYIQSLGIDCVQSVRNIISPREIDLFVPEFNLGIEYDGLYWHCETSGKSRTYHQEKTQLCKQQGVKLIHILDYEWKNKTDIVKSRLSNLLGKSQRLGARTCKIVELDAKTTTEFLSQTHIQGAVGSSIRLGLVHAGALVAVMTFGKARYNQNYQYELLRFSNALGVTVQGGASKLFSYFVNQYQPKSVISYCDLRWNTGSMYAQLGFQHLRDTKPNYWYTQQHLTFESRIKYQKHKLSKIFEDFDPGLSEWQNMIRNGYDRYWDCGNSVWAWKN
jgi:hypothetical protein